MKEIQINASVKSAVYVGEGAFQKVPALLKGQKNFLLTDSNVYELYGGLISETFASTPTYVLPAGEENKTFDRLGEILAAMAQAGLLRSSCLFVLGGGVVGDMGGLAAGLYMRGIRCVQIPTTLLAQVDSSVGGKTAVDHGGIKNLVGMFYQPKTVLVDPMFFETLPIREIKCGLGEIVKYGTLSAEILRVLMKQDNLFDLAFLAEIVPACIDHKADVVRKDERETGIRKSLNMGHTTGHAFELYDKKLSHGEYVLIGLWYETGIAEKKGLVKKEYADQIRSLILRVIDTVPAVPQEALYRALLDKKNETSGTITLVIPVQKGIYDTIKLPYEEYAALIKAVAEEL
ncbi:MAG: 3-dehydroquinate synthase family protein [Christensenellaceae bacterium]